jgi:hypothetical protein
LNNQKDEDIEEIQISSRLQVSQDFCNLVDPTLLAFLEIQWMGGP